MRPDDEVRVGLAELRDVMGALPATNPIALDPVHRSRGIRCATVGTAAHVSGRGPEWCAATLEGGVDERSPMAPGLQVRGL